MKEELVKEVLLLNKLEFCKYSTIFVTIKPSISTYQYVLGDFLYSYKQHILHFNHIGIIIIPLNEMSGKLLDDSLVIIPYNEIESKEIKINLMTFKLILKTKKGNIEYKIRKNALGCPWHKENLSFILLYSSIKTGGS